MIRFIQDKRPHYGHVDVYVNPSDVMSIKDINGERSTENRSRITIRNGDAYDITEYASVVAGMINAAMLPKEPPTVLSMFTGNTLEKLPVHPPATTHQPETK
jgi:hypothetical protein